MKIFSSLFVLVTGLTIGSEVVAAARSREQQAVLGNTKAEDPSAGTANSVGRPNRDSAVQNANHIFNTVHSSLRQWGSSLHHNGMAFFPASIPARTLLYHGTGSPDPVKGTEWLAFEIEHAEMFAQPRGPRNGTGPGGPHGPGGRPPPGNGKPPGPPPAEKHADNDYQMHGYLHTYETTRPLRNILYVDGMSGGKTPKGTLDTQDYILRLNSSTVPPPGSHPDTDYVRAQDLCALSEEWGLEFKIEGILRMEAGFELIMCDFADGSLELLSVNKRPDRKSGGQSVPWDDVDHLTGHFEYLRGVAARYGGIGGGRVKIAYENMVSVYFYDTDLGLGSSRDGLPRLVNVDKKILSNIKDDVRSMMVSQHQRDSQSVSEVTTRMTGEVTWQDVVDMIVSRYSDRLQFLIAADTTNEQFASELSIMLNTFIDYSAPSSKRISVARSRCQSHYLRAMSLSTPSDHLVHEAVSNVTGRICEVLFASWELVLAGQEVPEASRQRVGDWALREAMNSVHGLIDWLDWSTWRECGKCASDEICYVAIWPWGSVEDHEAPQCMNATMMQSRRGYWEDRRPV